MEVPGRICGRTETTFERGTSLPGYVHEGQAGATGI